MWDSKRKWVFGVTTLVLAAMALYPPYSVTVVYDDSGIVCLVVPVTTHDWIWASPRHVDVETLLFQWLCVIAVAAILSGLLSIRRQVASA